MNPAPVILLILLGVIGWLIWRICRDDPYAPAPTERRKGTMTPAASNDLTFFNDWLACHDTRLITETRKERPMADRITELRLEALESGKSLDVGALLKEALIVLETQEVSKQYSSYGHVVTSPNYDVVLGVKLIKLALKQLEQSA